MSKLRHEVSTGNPTEGGVERRRLAVERVKQYEKALDTILAPVLSPGITLGDLEGKVGIFAPATMTMVRTVARLRNDPNYKQKIRWVLESQFPIVKKIPSKFSIEIEDLAGLSVVVFDEALQEEMEKKRTGMHGMIFRADSSNEWTGLTVFVNGSSSKKSEILRHEAEHLLYGRAFEKYTYRERTDQTYLWFAVRDEMLAYLMGDNRIELNISRLLPVGVTINDVLDSWNTGDADLWAKSWNAFAHAYKKSGGDPEMPSHLKSMLINSSSFDEFFKRTKEFRSGDYFFQ